MPFRVLGLGRGWGFGFAVFGILGLWFFGGVASCLDHVPWFFSVRAWSLCCFRDFV